MIQTLVVAVSLLLVVRQLRYQRHANIVATLGALNERWTCPEMQRQRKLVCEFFGDGQNRINRPEEAVCGFFEYLGTLVREDVLPLSLAWDSFSFYLEHYFAMMQTHIKTIRAEFNDPSFFVQFEWLSDRMSTHGNKRRSGWKRFLGLSAPVPKLDLKKFIAGEKQTDKDYETVTTNLNADAK